MSSMAEATASRLSAALKRPGDEVAFVPYLMAGYPDVERSVALGRAYAAAGAAAIEVGIPFSDPLADGPTVQRAGQAALEGGMGVHGALEVAGRVADTGVPVVLMTYVNPILAYDERRFAADAAVAGAAGVLVPDLPVEEAGMLADWIRSAGLDMIFMVAPTSPDARVERIVEAASGFVYCVTVTGVTGARATLDDRLEALLERVRAMTPLPVAAGFGISRPEHVRALRGKADAVVVASALLERVHQGEPVEPLLAELAAACR
jgi:tryptophan synthase alpha chain